MNSDQSTTLTVEGEARWSPEEAGVAGAEARSLGMAVADSSAWGAADSSRPAEAEGRWLASAAAYWSGTAAAHSLGLAVERWSTPAAAAHWSLPEAGLPDEDVE